jgi:hypothetical protein
MSYWYLAHENELMIDLDDYDRSAKSGEPWGELFFRRRLREAIKAKLLRVKEVLMLPSQTAGHFHAMITLESGIPTLERLIWQLHLGSDLYRGRADLMRHAKGHLAPTLLITPWRIPTFRSHDARCDCQSKHVTEKIFEQPASERCKVWTAFRGQSPWELFGGSTREFEMPVPLPPGRVPLSLIMRKDNE